MTVLMMLSLLFPLPEAQRTPTTNGCGNNLSLQAQAVVLVPTSEPGRRFSMSGRVLDYAGRPLSTAAVVGYQADAGGLYNPPNSSTRVPRLRAVAITAIDGSFNFSTIVPGGYPDRSEPAHIHLVVTAPAHRVKYVDIWFEGDPLITPERLARSLLPDAATMIVSLRSSDSGLVAQCDIRLDSN